MQKKNWFGLLGMVLIAAIAYLPMVTKIGYLNDDWYLMYDGYVGGANFFHNVYSIDRPLRGYLMQAAFSFFGMNPLYYHLSAFLLRLLSGVALFWICNQLWSKRSFNNLLIAVLFLVYPGFLSQVNPIDYQSQIFSLACGMFSVALTIKALHAERSIERWGYTVLSILLGWLYLGLVEYFIGFEVLRLAIVGLLLWRDDKKTVRERLFSTFRAFIPFMVIAGGFLIWRLFFFEAERKATDVSLQLSALASSPLTALWWLNYLIQDIFKVTLVAWALPLNNFAFSLRLRDAFTGFGLATLCVLLMSILFRRNMQDLENEKENDSRREYEQIFLALVIIIAGLIPVIMVNRHVILPDYSRYTLASSAGVAILLSAVMDRISSRSIKFGMICFFVMAAVWTHYGNSMRVVYETEATQNFWWQVAWRAPQIKDGTTLIVSYPNAALSEDYFIWGPANFIYHPEKQNNNPVEIKLPATVLTNDAALNIMMQEGTETPLRRGNYLERDFSNILVMIQSSQNGCVRFMDGNAPELSSTDSERLLLVAPYSRLENVLVGDDFHTPPAVVFGNEPQHSWCYYYQKADLARQQGDWEQIPPLLKQALAQGYYPEDGLEWMPFLQASAVLGDVTQVRTTSKLIAIDKFMRVQSCAIMKDFMKKESLSRDVETVIEKNICK